MSIWCTNVLRIVGEPATVERFILENGDPIGRTLDEERLTFRALIPLDRQTDARPHWGVAKDASYVEKWDIAPWRDDQLEASCGFYTPDEPPKLWFEVAAKAYPTLAFALTYDQPDSELMGQLLGEHGAVSNSIWQDELPEDDEYEDEDA